MKKTWLGGEPVWASGEPVGPTKGLPLVRKTGRFDALSEAEARAALARCCASERWVEAMLSRRPFGNFRTLAKAAGEVWFGLEQKDWAEAFSAHPRIGEKFRQNREQAGVLGASQETLDRLARVNDTYSQKFGFGFLVFATGKTAEQMLGLMEKRLTRSLEEEWREAAAQHHKITLFRLAQLEKSPH